MDLAIFNALHAFLGTSSFLDWAGLFLAQYLPYGLILVALVFVFRMGTWKKKIFTSVIVALSVLLSREVFAESIRFFYDRPRPFLALHFDPLFIENSHAFPSGHAAFFFALAAAIYYFDKRWGYWFFGFAAVNGIARVFAGVHWPSDVLGGAVLGIISFLIVQKLIIPFLGNISSGVVTQPPEIKSTN